MLHITNGDCAAGVMRQAGIAGEILTWRDVLHEGPVPAGLPLEQLSEARARFIADCGWAEPDEVSLSFRERDAALANFRAHEEVILWFEHDLYDQLQLLQLLDWFSAQDLGATRLDLICIDEYLGTLTPERMAELPRGKVPVSAGQFQLARRAWSAFRAADPSAWAALLHEDTSALPFLEGAVLRHLEQYPSSFNGLNRTGNRILEAVRSGLRERGQIFEATQQAEERVFMGDSTFWLYLDAMHASRPPLVTASGELTQTGGKVLRGELDWIELNGIDKWLGGVRLETSRHWRWDKAQRRLIFQNRQSN